MEVAGSGTAIMPRLMLGSIVVNGKDAHRASDPAPAVGSESTQQALKKVDLPADGFPTSPMM